MWIDILQDFAMVKDYILRHTFIRPWTSFEFFLWSEIEATHIAAHSYNKIYLDLEEKVLKHYVWIIWQANAAKTFVLGGGVVVCVCVKIDPS